MTFNERHIALNEEDRYYLEGYGEEATYKQLPDIYHQLRACFSEALDKEWAAIGRVHEASGADMAGIMGKETYAALEATYLAYKIRAAHRAFVQYVYLLEED